MDLNQKWQVGKKPGSKTHPCYIGFSVITESVILELQCILAKFNNRSYSVPCKVKQGCGLVSRCAGWSVLRNYSVPYKVKQGATLSPIKSSKVCGLVSRCAGWSVFRSYSVHYKVKQCCGLVSRCAGWSVFRSYSVPYKVKQADAQAGLCSGATLSPIKSSKVCGLVSRCTGWSVFRSYSVPYKVKQADAQAGLCSGATLSPIKSSKVCGLVSRCAGWSGSLPAAYDIRSIVIIDDCDNSITYTFPCNRWLAKDEDDGQIFRDLVAGIGATEAFTGFPYVITVMTGDKANAGTDAKVFVILHNGKKKQDSGKVWLSDRSFKRGMTEIFTINLQAMLSPLTSLEIGHDDSGIASGWYCDQVIVYCPNTGIEQFFPCRKWLSKSDGDFLIQRTLYEDTGRRKTKEKKDTWNVWVKTSDVSNAGTDANVVICLYGKKGKSEEIPLDNKGDNFEKGKVDLFKVNIQDVGLPYKLRVYHDDSGRAAGWHLDRINIENISTKEKFEFLCNRWLAVGEDDGSIVRELPATGPGIKNPLPLDKYVIQVFTGSRSMAGTNANVYINIFGERGDTGIRFLKKSQNFDKFEKGKMDEFTIEAVSVLKLTKIRIGHDGKGAGAGWFLDKVIVRQAGEKKFEQEFICQRWLAEDMDDGLIEREITCSGTQMLSTTSYHVHVKTGDVANGGTDANVHLIMYGDKGDTGKLMLRQSDSYRNKFERGKTDTFKLEATDIGKIKRIKIGHDGTNLGASWFLDSVTILVPSRGEQYLFACHRWLGKDEADGLLEIEMEPAEVGNMDKTIPYEVTVWTGNVQGGGTDANVFLQMYGPDGKTEEIALRNKTDNFEQGMCDKFKIEAPDIGRILKVRIGHDGKGMMSGWFLEKLLIQRRPRKGTKKFRPRSSSSGRSDPDKRVASSRMGDLSDSDDSDISSVSQSRRLQRKMKTPKQSLKTVQEETDVYDGDETEDYFFFVKRWFARSEDDKQIVRELIPTDESGRPLKGGLEETVYNVHIFTGNISGAGTDSNVFLNIYGQNGDTGEREMKDSSTHGNKFEKNQ
ncbi:hypothetical protein DPMN_011402, partial [Dreissena polymorpha]